MNRMKFGRDNQTSAQPDGIGFRDKSYNTLPHVLTFMIFVMHYRS